jgi:hypothetical protein
VNDAPLVRCLNGGSNLHREFQSFFRGNRSAPHDFGQRVTFDQLEDKKARAAGLFETIDSRNVGMVERRQHPGLSFEANQALRISGKLRRQRLDRHFAPQPGVERPPNFSHAALSQGGENLVSSKLTANLDDHAAAIIGAEVTAT